MEGSVLTYRAMKAVVQRRIDQVRKFFPQYLADIFLATLVDQRVGRVVGIYNMPLVVDEEKCICHTFKGSQQTLAELALFMLLGFLLGYVLERADHSDHLACFVE